MRCSLCGNTLTRGICAKCDGGLPAPAPGPGSPRLAPRGSGSYGSGVRSQVFEVIVRQALAGAPWKEICAGPMQVNNIRAEEVEEEVRRRRGEDDHPLSGVPKRPHPTTGTGNIALPEPSPDEPPTGLNHIVKRLMMGLTDPELSDDSNDEDDDDTP
ncbi:MAG TPA: hypothetical protein V6D17_18380 [Candidatus Obscuribacterales bacterium]